MFYIKLKLRKKTFPIKYDIVLTDSKNVKTGKIYEKLGYYIKDIEPMHSLTPIGFVAMKKQRILKILARKPCKIDKRIFLFFKCLDYKK